MTDDGNVRDPGADMGKTRYMLTILIKDDDESPPTATAVQGIICDVLMSNLPVDDVDVTEISSPAASHSPETETEDGEASDERMLADLLAYKDAGVLKFVIPSIPAGEWVIGIGDQVVKLVTKDEVCAFLTGISYMGGWIAEQAREKGAARFGS